MAQIQVLVLKFAPKLFTLTPTLPKNFKFSPLEISIFPFNSNSTLIKIDGSHKYKLKEHVKYINIWDYFVTIIWNIKEKIGHVTEK